MGAFAWNPGVDSQFVLCLSPTRIVSAFESVNIRLLTQISKPEMNNTVEDLPLDSYAQEPGPPLEDVGVDHQQACELKKHTIAYKHVKIHICEYMYVIAEVIIIACDPLLGAARGHPIG